MRCNQGITKAQWRKDAPGLFLCCAIIAVIPIAVVLARPRPLSANTIGELVSIVREQTAEEASTIIRRHKNSWKLQTSESRWQEVEQSMYESDNDLTTEEASRVLQAAKPALANRAWPLLARRARLNEQDVWIVASGDIPSDPVYICNLVSAEEKKRDRIEAARKLMSFVVVSSHAPYQVISEPT